jgi:hypothetical protein
MPLVCHLLDMHVIKAYIVTPLTMTLRTVLTSWTGESLLLGRVQQTLAETGSRPAIYYIATNGRTDTRWRGEPLTKQIKDKERKTRKNQNYGNNETIASGIGAPRRRPQEGNDTTRRRRRDREVKGFHPEP